MGVWRRGLGQVCGECLFEVTKGGMVQCTVEEKLSDRE